MALKIWTAQEKLHAADLNNNFTELTHTAKTLILASAIQESSPAPHNGTLTTNTTAIVGQVIVPFKITVNKISILTGGGANTLDLTLYSEDGQTQIFSVTTPTLAGGVTTTVVNSVVVQPGIYYLMANTNVAGSIGTYMWSDQNNPFASTNSLMSGVTSEPVLQGTMTITAGTPPATFNPSTQITASLHGTIISRLDN